MEILLMYIYLKAVWILYIVYTLFYPFFLFPKMDRGHMIIDSMILKKHIKLCIIRISKIDVKGHHCFLKSSEIYSYDSINLWHTILPKDICLVDKYLRWSLLYDIVEIMIAKYQNNIYIWPVLCSQNFLKNWTHETLGCTPRQW